MYKIIYNIFKYSKYWLQYLEGETILCLDSISMMLLFSHCFLKGDLYSQVYDNYFSYPESLTSGKCYSSSPVQGDNFVFMDRSNDK